MQHNETILIEDEEVVRLATTQTLQLAGYSVRECGSAESAMEWVTPKFSGVIITDMRLPGRSGLQFLNDVASVDSDIPIIVVTGHGDVNLAVEAMRAGAYDFIEKPFSADRLTDAVHRAQEKRKLCLDNRYLKMTVAACHDMPLLIGESPEIERVRAMIRTVGATCVDVLINGQTGTGKEVVARQLHVSSGRKGPFVAINCGALPEAIFESEIFGHEPGAFTSAQKRRIGKLEYANGGTVFLDEIESMPLSLQVKLLRVLQERRLERLGGNDTVKIDCRIIAASKADLLKLGAEGSFREDLYYRIGVVSIDLPPLSRRRGDIPLLLVHFLNIAAIRHGKAVPQWTAAQMTEWQSREWPGNVRELRNFAERIVLGLVEQEIVFDSARPLVKFDAPLPVRVEEYEQMLVMQALKAAAGNVALASERLGVPRKTLYDKIKRAQLAGLAKDDGLPASVQLENIQKN